MPAPIPTPSEISPEVMARMSEWAKVLDTPAGKGRFQAIRTMLRDYLQDTAQAPNSSKKFLSEKLIRSVGPSGAASKLPKDLRRMLGAGADDFAREVQTAYYFLTGRAPKGPTNQAFKSMLSAMQGGGMPASHIAQLRKMGPAKVIAAVGSGGGLRTLLSGAGKNPAIGGVVGWAALKTAGTPVPIPLPMEALADAVVGKAPTAAAAVAPAAATGVKGALGKGPAVAGGALRKISTVLPGIAVGAAGLTINSIMKAKQEEEQRAQEMLATGVIPDELGGPVRIPKPDGSGESITASQFLSMMDDRESNLKRARFNAMSQEAGTTREVMKYITGGEDSDPRQVQRMKLGAARSPQRQGMKPDKMMEQFDMFLRQVTSGPSGG